MNLKSTKSLAALVVLFFLAVLYFKESNPETVREPLSPNAVILAFGDSLTYGYGAVNYAYPVALEKMLKREVINEGVSGEVSADGLKRLPALLEKYHPDLVILCHGGNDILRKYSKTALKNNLKKMIILSRNMGAEVLLVGVPGFGLLGLSTLPLYDEVAQEEKVMYEGNVLETIENSPALKSDRIHPNGIGYKMMAEAFVRVLQEHGMI